MNNNNRLFVLLSEKRMSCYRPPEDDKGNSLTAGVREVLGEPLKLYKDTSWVFIKKDKE